MAQALSRDRRRVVLSYLVMALAWMISTDSVVQALVPDPQQAALWQGLKGSFFALASAGLLYLLLRPLAEHVLHTHARQQASELRLRQMFEGNPGPILVYDLDTLAILDANPAACTAFGWERDELLEQTIDALWPPGQGQALQAKLEAIREAPDELCILRAQLQLRDGALRQMELRSNAISYDGHNARLLIAIDRTAEDLAQLRQALEAGCERILLDDFSPDLRREAVRITAGRIPLEVSGSVGLGGLRSIAEDGVDCISIGGLTKHVQAIDLSLKLGPPPG